LAKEALEEFLPIRRCTKAMSAGTRFAPCALADIGRCVAPCDGRADPERYGELVRRLVSSLTSPGGLLRALERRMAVLAEQERYEEARLVRDRLRALADALARARMDAWFVGAGALTLRDGTGSLVRFTGGALVRGDGAEPLQIPCSRETADELAAVRGWLRVHHPQVQECGRPLAEPVDGGAAIARVQAQSRAAEDDRARARARS
jgi:hypothetical protein